MKYIMMLLLAFSMQMAGAQEKAWTVWKTSPCYSKIEYRYQYQGERGERKQWLLQFRNKYPRVVHFNYSLASDLEEDLLAYSRRKSLPANAESETIEFFSNSAQFRIQVSNLSFKIRATDFEPCDEDKRPRN